MNIKTRQATQEVKGFTVVRLGGGDGSGGEKRSVSGRREEKEVLRRRSKSYIGSTGGGKRGSPPRKWERSPLPLSITGYIRDRRTQILLARLRIGHTYLTQRNLLTRDPQPYCYDCLVPLTVRHLLVECPGLMDLRHRYLYRCRGGHSAAPDDPCCCGA
ncbi:hypothetical protein E2C01_058350 [Portunus trituberculatus]|uniref:Uncharacterized protein n=1 Tax=Portunus trituberculatus TaxID=210409 RepID=A0A5B7H2R1_PORTR|nr:hypothetical protein [Portunus trituberculatus]